MKKPKRLYFGQCPVCGLNHSVRVIRFLGSEKKGRYVVWCRNLRRFEVLYKQK